MQEVLNKKENQAKLEILHKDEKSGANQLYNLIVLITVNW